MRIPSKTSRPGSNVRLLPRPKRPRPAQMGPSSRKPPGRRPAAPHSPDRSGPVGPARPESDQEPYGRTALMVCESLILTLVESGVINRSEALNAVEAVLAVKEGMAPDEDGAQVSARLLRALAASLVAAGPGPLD